MQLGLRFARECHPDDARGVIVFGDDRLGDKVLPDRYRRLHGEQSGRDDQFERLGAFSEFVDGLGQGVVSAALQGVVASEFHDHLADGGVTDDRDVVVVSEPDRRSMVRHITDDRGFGANQLVQELQQAQHSRTPVVAGHRFGHHVLEFSLRLTLLFT